MVFYIAFVPKIFSFARDNMKPHFLLECHRALMKQKTNDFLFGIGFCLLLCSILFGCRCHFKKFDFFVLYRVFDRELFERFSKFVDTSIKANGNIQEKRNKNIE